ncbi:MAG: c-type cytochrome [Bryobacteraceae bacterium]|nr:c-type cytochrome [Bryobacteraceae bacterium]
MKAKAWIAPSLLAAAILGLSGCGENAAAVLGEQATGGDAQLGRKLTFRHDCGSCHIIPGVAAANGTVGPTLERFGRRGYIAGALPNTPENLVEWIVEPHRIRPNSGMPDLGVSPDQARHMAAYLYSLQ